MQMRPKRWRLSVDTTTRIGPMGPSGTSCRSRGRTPAAASARRRKAGWKLQRPALQERASHHPAGSSPIPAQRSNLTRLTINWVHQLPRSLSISTVMFGEFHQARHEPQDRRSGVGREDLQGGAASPRLAREHHRRGGQRSANEKLMRRSQVARGMCTANRPS